MPKSVDRHVVAILGASMNNRNGSGNSSSDKYIGLALGIGLLLALLYFLFNPPELNSLSYPLVGFLAAMTAGCIAYIFAGELAIEGYLGNLQVGGKSLNKLTIRAVGAFAAFITILVFFWAFIPKVPEPNQNNTSEVVSYEDFSGKYLIDGNIQYRHLTARGWYSSLAFLEPVFPDHLKNILGLKYTPIIHTSSPAYQSIIHFINETGNEIFFGKLKDFGGSSYSYRTTRDGQVVSGNLSLSGDGTLSGVGVGEEEVVQDVIQPEKFSPSGEDQEFKYINTSVPFQKESENYAWTSLVHKRQIEHSSDSLKNINSGVLVQFPKLSSILNSGILDATWADDYWISQVAKRNPEDRGFLGFAYDYLAKDEVANNQTLLDWIDSLILCGFAGVKKVIRPPYVRFLDLWNSGTSSMNLDSITYNIIEKNDYDLTNADSRNEIFKGSTLETMPVGITLPAENHLFILSEFGFGGKDFKQSLSYRSNNSIDSTQPKKFYVAYPSPGVISDDLDSGKVSPEELIEELSLNSDGRTEFNTLTNIVNSLSENLAVGTMLEIVSVRVDGQDIDISSPLDSTPYSWTVHYGYGSCPYLLVFNSKEKQWIEDGTVLTSRNDKSRKGTEVYRFYSGETKFRIEERDREISYIDFMQIRYTTAGSDEVGKISVPISSLQKIDDDYLVLHQGESFEFDISKLLPKEVSDCELVIDGFYEVTDT